MPPRFIDSSNPRFSHFWLPSYPQTIRVLNVVLGTVIAPAMNLCMSVVRTLAAIYPDKPVGVYLSVDGTGIAANVAQTSSGGGADKAKKEAHLRRNQPEAGFTVLSKRRFKDGDGRRYTTARVVRGYIWIVISDVLSGLAVDGVLLDAGKLGREPHVLPELLQRLFAKWPNCPVEYLIADGAWDSEEAVEFAIRRYGITLVVRRNKRYRDAKFFPTGKTKIGWVTGLGEAYCRSHGKQMRWVGVEVPNRKALGVKPGDELDASLFRVRFEGDCGCGRASIGMKENWSALAALPHTPFGRPDLHARRTALYAARNTSENVFASLKMGHAQGLAGSHRTRLNDANAVEGMLWLTVALRALFTLRATRSS